MSKRLLGILFGFVLFTAGITCLVITVALWLGLLTLDTIPVVSLFLLVLSSLLIYGNRKLLDNLDDLLKVFGGV